MIEEWRPIEGYENLYEVSNTGLVRNVTRGRLLRPGFDKNGYLKCVLSKNGKARTAYIHRLVAEAFIKNPMYLPQINHKDEDKTNNRVENLEWCTPRYNVNYGSAQKRRIQKNIDNGKCLGFRTEDIKEYRRIYTRRYREKNREKVREKNREYMRKHRDRINENNRKYREKNREKVREKNREYMKKYREKNREMINEKNRKYREKNREKVREKNREYMRKHREKNKEKKEK